MPYKPTGRRPGRPRKAPYDLCSDEPPKLTDEQRKALEIEFKHFDWNKEPWPSKASLRRVAEHAGRSHETVRNWRKGPAYRRGLFDLFAREISPTDEKKMPTVEARSNRSRQKNLTHFHVALLKTWTGSVKSPLNGRIYENPEDYFEHIVNQPGFVWIGHKPDDWFMKPGGGDKTE